MSQFFLARNFTSSGSRHDGKIGSDKFELIFDANASVDKSLSSVYELLILIFFFEKETNGPYGTALYPRKRLFDEQFEGRHKFI